MGDAIVPAADPKPHKTSSSRRAAFRGDIQGLRAIAVLAVLLYHCKVPAVQGGYVGVDVFFVVSGFLITGHLAGELTSTNQIKFGEFYARRARRILPASFTVLILTVIAAVIWQPPVQLSATLQDAAATALYVPNVLFAYRGTDYLAETAPSAFQHYWSLGIEEQFYFVWPLVIIASYKLFGRNVNWLMAALSTVAVVSFSISVYLTPVNAPIAFFALPSRAWELAVGGVLALAMASSPKWTKTATVASLGWLGLGMIVYAIFGFTENTSMPGWQASVPVIGTALVILSGASQSALSTKRLLSVRPALFIGGISYSLYLVHWPLLVIPQDAIGLDNALPMWVVLLLGMASIPLGWLLFRFVEVPWRNSRFLVGDGARRTLVIAAAASVLIATTSGLGMRVVHSRPLSSTQTVAEVELQENPAGVDFVPANLEPSLWHAAESSPDIYSNGCHSSREQTKPKICIVGANETAPLVVLFGDSHAAQWYPALQFLALRGQVRLQTFTKSSCPSASLDKPHYPQCAVWRDAVIKSMAEKPPDIVLLGNFAYQVDHAMGGPAVWKAALSETIRKLPDSSKVLIVADTPNVHVTPAICLSAHPDSASTCFVRRETALNDEVRQAEQNLGVGVIDLTNWMCNQVWCPSIIGHFLVYRDAHHLTVPFSNALGPALGAEIDRKVLSSVGGRDPMG